MTSRGFQDLDAGSQLFMCSIIYALSTYLVAVNINCK